MNKTRVLAAVVLPQVALFYVLRGVVRAITDHQQHLADGFELAVIEELLTWERAADAVGDPDDDRLFPRVLP
jgi:hypothetical protein